MCSSDLRLDDAVNEVDVGSAGTLALAVALGVLAEVTQIDHGAECSQGGHWRRCGPGPEPRDTTDPISYVSATYSRCFYNMFPS